MGFEILKSRVARATGVAVNVTKIKGAKEGTSGLSGAFRIGGDVAEQAGWKDKEPVQILIGKDENAGEFILKPSRDGRTKAAKAKSGASLTVSFSAVAAGFSEPTKGTQEVQHEVGRDGEIHIKVPGLQGASGRKGRKS
jgi:hypothetical protein